MDSDPYELRNLYPDLTMQDVAEELKGRLAEMKAELSDRYNDPELARRLRALERR